MASAEKFDFGRDFGRAGGAPLTPSASERARAEIEADARARGYAEGLAEGRLQAQRELDQRIASALEETARRAGEVLAAAQAVEAAAADEAVAFSLRFAEAVAGAAARRFPLAALEAAARETFAQLRQAPHCVVRVHESLVEAATERLSRAARERGFEGKLVVMGEMDLALGDFALEWADGGVRRDGEALRRRLDAAIERHFPAAADMPDRPEHS